MALHYLKKNPLEFKLFIVEWFQIYRRVVKIIEISHARDLVSPIITSYSSMRHLS